MLPMEVMCKLLTCCMVHKALALKEPQYLSERLLYREEVSNGAPAKTESFTFLKTGEMVVQFSAWRHKLASKAAAMSHYTPDMFVKSQWQKTAQVSVIYLVYRWVMAGVFVSVLVASMTEVGRENTGFSHYAKWPIYLTHWGFTICTLQAVIAAYLVTRAHCQQPGLDDDGMKMSWCMKLYHVLHTCATIGAFAITAIYWLFVFNPEEHELDTLNLLVHAGNSILMLTDLIIISHPVRLIDFYWPISFSVLYVTFNYIYFIAGGTDRKGNRYIYKILDWRRPGRTLLIVQACLVFVLVLHLSVCVFCLARTRFVERCRRSTLDINPRQRSDLQGIDNAIPIDDLV